MRITCFPIHALDDAALKKVAIAWGEILEARIKSRYGERFELKWSSESTFNQTTPAAPLQGYDQEIALSENGRPDARIVLRAPAELPRTFECTLEPAEPPVKLGSKTMKFFCVLAAVAAFLGWLYFAIFGDGWSRSWNRITNFGPCRDCASKLEMFYLVVAGWLVVPVMAAFPFYLLGDWLDGVLTGLRSRQAWRRLDKDLHPWLKEAMRDMESRATADPELAQIYGLAAIEHKAAGSPHETFPNVVWDGTSNLRPAPGFVWSGDAASYDVVPKDAEAPT